MTEMCRLLTGYCILLKFNSECVDTLLTKTPIIKFHESLPPGSHSVTCRWTNIVNFVVTFTIVFWKYLKFSGIDCGWVQIFCHFTAEMTIFTTGSQFVTSLHHPYWCMISDLTWIQLHLIPLILALMCSATPKHFPFFLFFLFFYFFIYTIRCHKLLSACWRNLLSFTKSPVQLFPLIFEH